MARTSRANPWDRQTGESAPAWEAFVTYRDMGPARSLTKVAQELSKSDALMKRWSAEHAWVIRAAGWDAEKDRVWQVELRAAQRSAAKRSIDLGEAMKKVAAQSLAAIATSGDTLKAGELARLLEVATRIEQLAFATIPAGPVDGAGAGGLDEVDLEALSDEEIAHHMLTLRREIDADLAEYPDLVDDAEDGGFLGLDDLDDEEDG